MPQPFLPNWLATIGPITEHGQGLLSQNVKASQPLIDLFSVNIGPATVRVFPREGCIQLDSHRVVDLKKPSKLIWFRRMEMELGTHDANSAAPECLWYGIGLEHDGKQIGYRIYRDGRLKEGLNA